MNWSNGYGYGHMGWAGHMGWGGLWWIVCALVVAGLVWALVRIGASPAGGSNDESPTKILKRRYAKGEIDRDTYQRTLTDLKG